MKKTTASILGLACCAALWSCVKDRLYDMPPASVVIVTADWTNRSENCAIPSEYTLYHSCCDNRAYTLDGGNPTPFPTPLEEGSHTVVACNTPEGFVIEGLTARVAAAADGTIAARPGYLLTTVGRLEAVKGTTTHTTLPMRQRIRDLYIVLTVTEGRPERITEIEGSLTGMARAFDLSTQQITGESARATCTFELQGDEASCALRMLGPTGDRQLLTLRLVFTDATTQIIETDLTASLSGFVADDMTTPLIIRGNLSTPVETGLSASITDWTVGEKLETDIH